MKHISTLVVLLAVTGIASAVDIHLDWTSTDLGGGLTGYTFSIRNDDGLSLSYAATVGFEAYGDAAMIANMLFGMPPQRINDETQIPWEPFVYGIDPAVETYSLIPFVQANSIQGDSRLFGDTFIGYREDVDWWEFSVGTGASSGYGDNTSLAYVVADGDVHWIGTIARNGVLYDVEGWTPEPATLAMLGIGAAALLRRRR